MKRYARYNQIGTGTSDDPIRPDTPAGTSYSVLGYRGGQCLVKLNLPDGTAKDVNTVADAIMESDGQGTRLVEIAADALTTAQRTALRTWVQANHPAWLATLDAWTDDDDGDAQAGIRNRRRYLKLLARIFGFNAGEWRTVLHGYSVNS